jgi:initiation factor 1A
MVKNAGGGKRAKGLARKNVNSNKSSQEKPLRVAQEEDEIYAIVTKLFGNGMCDVLCIDNVTRLCHIRGIFRGRSKRDNCIELGSWTLVGKRSYETVVKDKKQNCDLLEVYNRSEKEKLRTSVTSINWNMFVKLDNQSNNIEEDLDDGFGIKFADATETEYMDLMARLKEPTSSASASAAAKDLSSMTIAEMNAILGDREIDLDEL